MISSSRPAKPAVAGQIDGGHTDGGCGPIATDKTQRPGPHPTGSGFEPVLLDLARLAAQSISGVDGAGVAVIRDGVTLFGSSNPFCEAVDAGQYRVGQGPCLDAVATGRTVVSGSIGRGEGRWPRFTAETSPHQVGSVLSLPLHANNQVIGSINCYAHAAQAFDEAAVAAGEMVAEPIGAALAGAQVMVDAYDLTASVGDSLQDQGIEEMAVGIIMVTEKRTMKDARRRLHDLAAAADTTLAEVAADLVDRTVRRPNP